jgi:hypothetical protein
MKQDAPDKEPEGTAGSPGTGQAAAAEASDAEPIDVEEYATKDLPTPDSKRYRIRVDRAVYIVDGSLITGRQILEVSGHLPVEHWRLDQRFRGGATKKVELNDVVDLRAKGLERFMTLPLDQTEGAEETPEIA